MTILLINNHKPLNLMYHRSTTLKLRGYLTDILHMYKRFIPNRFILNTKNITQTIFYNSNFYNSDNILSILIILSLEAIGSPCQTLKPLPPPPPSPNQKPN